MQKAVGFGCGVRIVITLLPRLPISALKPDLGLREGTWGRPRRVQCGSRLPAHLPVGAQSLTPGSQEQLTWTSCPWLPPRPPAPITDVKRIYLNLLSTDLFKSLQWRIIMHSFSEVEYQDADPC